MYLIIKFTCGLLMFGTGVAEFHDAAGRVRILFGLYVMFDAILDKTMPRAELAPK